MTKELLSSKEVAELDRFLKSRNKDQELPMVESYVINGKICCDKKEMFEKLNGDKLVGPQIRCLTQKQTFAAIGGADESFRPDFLIEGEQFYDIASVEKYLADKFKWDKRSIDNVINEAVRKNNGVGAK